MLTRRNCLLLGVAAGPARNLFGFAPADPWNEKKPAEWSDKDRERLITHSPWAKETSIEMGGPVMSGGGGRGRGRGGGGGMGGGDMSAGGGGEMESGGGRGGSNRASGFEDSGGMGGSARIPVFVRWLSAKPITEAMRAKLPPAWADSYAIGVTGVPLGGRGRGGASAAGSQADPAEQRKKMMEGLKAATELQRKGKDPIAASDVQLVQAGQSTMMVFLFPRASQPIQAVDKEVTFAVKTAAFSFKVKFALKDMTYEGELAV